MPGIIDLYANFAKSHVQLYVKKGKVEEISRAKVELQLLNQIDQAELPFEYKLSWIHAVLASPNFEALWKAASKRHTLPKSCTERYVPDQTLLEFEPPTDNEVEEGAEDAVKTETDKEIHDDAPAAESISPTSVSQPPALTPDHESRSSTPDSDHSSGSSNWEFDYERDQAIPFKRPFIPTCKQCNERGHTALSCPENAEDEEADWSSDASADVLGGHEGKELAKRLGAGLPRGPKPVKDPLPRSQELCEDPRAVLDDVNGLAREEGNDGSYEESPPKGKGKGKAKSSCTVKGASKPKGVTKNKATPKKKEQTPAQLMTAAAKTREPTKPKAIKKAATKKAATTPSTTATTPVHPPYNGNDKQTQAATVPGEVNKKIAQIQAEMGPSQERGIKRRLEQSPEDEDDEDFSLATKKAKTGGAASVNGGRKKAAPKKSKQKGLQEWDGIPKGFGEY